jgi:hypothetical protein
VNSLDTDYLFGWQPSSSVIPPTDKMIMFAKRTEAGIEVIPVDQNEKIILDIFRRYYYSLSDLFLV